MLRIGGRRTRARSSEPDRTALTVEPTPEQFGRPFLFLSYASTDRERAIQVADYLESAGVPVWIDHQGISAGSTWAGKIVAAIRDCRAMLVLCSDTSLRSRNVRQELQLAWDHDRPIFPVLIEPVEFPDDVSYFLQGRQWIDAKDRTDTSWIAELSSAFSQLDVSGAPLARLTDSRNSHAFTAPPKPLVGRERELADILRRLHGGARLITLTGSGGVGKTQLALEVAGRVAESFAGDVKVIDVSTVVHPAQISSAIAQALGVRESAQRSLLDALELALRDRRMLLVLDNFEHVIEAASLVAGLVVNCQALVILVTSREALRVRVEEVVTIDPLDLPTSQEESNVEALLRLAAVQLFVQTARQVKPGFELTPANAPAISAICRRVEGLPLAIELAASRLRYFPPAILLENLDHRLALTGGSRDMPARHQTLRDTIAWSYDLLTGPEQSLLRRIGAFPAGVSLASLASYARVAGALDVDPLGGLASLVDKSLIRERLGADDAPRFSMLETIREFAGEMAEQLGENETRDQAILASVLDFVGLGKGSVMAWVLGAENLREVDDELTNVRAGFALATARKDAEACAIIFTGMHGYMLVRGLYREAIAMGRQVLELAEATPISDQLRGRTLTDLSYFWTTLVDPVEGEHMANDGLALARSAPDDEIHLISALDGPLVALRDQGRFAEALGHAEEADVLASKLGERHLLRGSTKYFLGNICRLIDDRSRAITFLHEAVQISQGNEIGIYAGSDLVDVYLRQGQVVDAASTLRKVMGWWQEAGSGVNGRPLDRAALVAAAGHHPDAAAKLFAVNAAQNAMYGMRDRDDPWTIDALATTRARLGNQGFESAAMEGRALTLDQATLLTLQVLDEIEASGGTAPVSQA